MRYTFIKEVKEVELETCKCGNKGVSDHTCPFATEIHDDYTLCNCCEACQQECCYEI